DGKKKGKEPGRLADVPVGATVTLRLSVDQTAVVALQAEGATVHGGGTAVDAARHTITPSHKGGADRTYPVSKGGAGVLDGKGGKKLADVPVEAAVQMKLLVDQKTVREIHASGPTVHGTVSGNAGEGSLTLSTKEGDTTYSVAKGALILIEEKCRGK